MAMRLLNDGQTGLKNTEKRIRQRFAREGDFAALLRVAHLDDSVGEFVRAVWESKLSNEEKSKIITCGLAALKGDEF